MNVAQWFAAFLVFNLGLFIGWVKGFNAAKGEYFYRGKSVARAEYESHRWEEQA